MHVFEFIIAKIQRLYTLNKTTCVDLPWQRTQHLTKNDLIKIWKNAIVQRWYFYTVVHVDEGSKEEEKLGDEVPKQK